MPHNVSIAHRLINVTAVSIVAVLMTAGGYFGVQALSRDRLGAVAATEHESLTRQSCIDCHEPIAAEWRQSFHYRSLSGPFWHRISEKGFDDVFRALRVPCANCHAPASVLDLAEGNHPRERSDQQEFGVDCVSCHVSRGRITGAGRGGEAPHEVVVDKRFTDPTLASTSICAHCHDESPEHAKTVKAWRQSEFAARGVTCLDCHMPPVEAPSVEGGPIRARRSHSFVGDKSDEMLRKALNVSLGTNKGRAVLTITNDRIPHALPAGGTNWLLASLHVEDDSGRELARAEQAFGTREWIPGYLDFWPFQEVSKIPPGATRTLHARLPGGHGILRAEFRYRDWFAVKDRDRLFATVVKRY